MRKSKKQLLRTLIACGLVVSVAAGGTVAYLTDAETATNTFTIGRVQIDLEEPGYPGNDSDEVKNIVPNQEIVKDPQIENTGNNDALTFLRVEVPQEMFTDGDDGTGAQKKQDLFRLKGVSDQWELLRTETVTGENGKAKTSYVYGYKKTLGKGATTDKLFQKVQMKNAVESDLSSNVEDIIVTACAIQATDIQNVNLTPGSDGNLSKDALDQVYTIFLNQSGNQISRPSDKDDQNPAGKLGKISYALDGGTLADGSLTEYGSANYGYTPPEPTKTGFTFAGWSPASIPTDSTGNITFTAQWEANKQSYNIHYVLDGGTLTGEKTEYTSDDYGYTPPTPTKEGCKFTGWSPASIPSGTTGEITFTAGWEDTKAKTATFLPGKQFNTTLRAIQTRYKTNIKRLENWTESEAPDAQYLIAGNIVSSDASGTPIYVFTEDSSGIYYWYSEAEKYCTDVNCNEMFYGGYLNNMTYVDFSKFDTSNATSMERMFYQTHITNLDLTSFDTSNVTTFKEMFYYANSTSINVSSFRGKQVQSMQRMFAYASAVTSIDLSQLGGTPKLNDLTSAFDNCKAATKINVSGITTAKVSKASKAFYYCEKVSELNLSNWDTSLMQEYDNMLYQCVSLTDLYLGAEFGHTGDIRETALVGYRYSYGYGNQNCKDAVRATKVHGANEYVKTFTDYDDRNADTCLVFHNFV